MQRSILLMLQNLLSHACARTRTHCSFVFLLSQVSHLHCQHTESKPLMPILTSSHVSLIHKTQTTGHFPQNNRSLSTKRRLVFIKTRDIFIKTRPTIFFQCPQKAIAINLFAPCCDTCDSKKHKIPVIRARVREENFAMRQNTTLELVRS